LRRSILACGLLLAFAGMATAAAAAGGSGGSSATTASTTGAAASPMAKSGPSARVIAAWRRHIRGFRAGVRRWEAVMRGRPPAGAARPLTARSLGRLRQLARRWRRREHTTRWRAKHPPELAAWLCIHRYEGSWTDSGSPYWGGLQMDYSFQRTYGAWLLRHRGTADHWSPLEQIWTAVRASHVRGFSPWPNTARYCGVA
jgi:hypothetical protein